MAINQTHYGSGDNVAGDKIVVNKPVERSIQSVKIRLIEEIRKHPQNYKIFLSNGDSEMYTLAQEINKAFSEAGWKNVGFVYNLAGFYPSGVTVGVKEPGVVAQFIADTFHSAALKVVYQKVNTAEDLSIYIGPHK